MVLRPMAMHRPNFDSEAKDSVVYIALITESASYSPFSIPGQLHVRSCTHGCTEGFLLCLQKLYYAYIANLSSRCIVTGDVTSCERGL
jgi:hypothetical protein